MIFWEIIYVFALACGTESVGDAVCTTVVGSARTHVLDASSDREDGSSDVCHVGDTR